MGLSVQYRFDTESRRIMADQIAEKMGSRHVNDAISAVFKSIMKKTDESQCILDCDTHSIYAMFEKNPLTKSISILGFNVDPKPQKTQPKLKGRQIIVRPPSSGPSTPSIHSSDFFSEVPSPDPIRPGHMRVSMDIPIPPLHLPKAANAYDGPPLFYGLSPIKFKTPVTISVQFAPQNKKPPEQVKQAPTIALIGEEKEQEPSNILQVGKRQFFLSSTNIADRELLAACLKQKTNCLNRKEKQKNLKPFALYFRDDAHYKMLKIGVKHNPNREYPFTIESYFNTDSFFRNKLGLSEIQYQNWKKQQPALPGN